jgi:hypothetical protein
MEVSDSDDADTIIDRLQPFTIIDRLRPFTIIDRLRPLAAVGPLLDHAIQILPYPAIGDAPQAPHNG